MGARLGSGNEAMCTDHHWFCSWVLLALSRPGWRLGCSQWSHCKLKHHNGRSTFTSETQIQPQTQTRHHGKEATHIIILHTRVPLTMEWKGVAGDIDGAAGVSSIPMCSEEALSFLLPRLSSLLELLALARGSFSSEAFLISSSSCFSRFL